MSSKNRLYNALATMALDEETVEESPHTWEDMFYKQARVPAFAVALIVSAVYLSPEILTPIRVVVLLGFVMYLCLPAVHAYRKMQEVRHDE